MWFMNDIIEWLDDAAIWFLDLHVECLYSYYIPDAVADIFYDLYRVFAHLAMSFYDFNELLEDWEDEIRDILSWSNIRSLIRDWLPDLEDTIDWWIDRWHWFQNEVGDWWDDVKSTVQGWIDIATEGLDSLVAEWDNFWTVTFPTLVSFDWLDTWWKDRLKDIDKLINDTIKDWFPWYDNLVQVKDELFEFFTDPLEWLLGKFTDWFLGPEE